MKESTKKQYSRIEEGEEHSYSPVLMCDHCKRIVRHRPYGVVMKEYQCVEPRRADTKEDEDRQRLDSWFELNLWRCVECGAVRGWGNQDIEGNEIDKV